MATSQGKGYGTQSIAHPPPPPAIDVSSQCMKTARPVGEWIQPITQPIQHPPGEPVSRTVRGWGADLYPTGVL